MISFRRTEKYQVCDDLMSLPSEVSSTMSPGDVFKFTCKTDCWQTLTVAVARMLAAKPHSADVERLITSYNNMKTTERSSLSANALSATLFVRHNMPPAALWDPRPATYRWMTTKERRPEPTPCKAKEQEYFKETSFRK